MKPYEVIELDEIDICKAIAEKYLVKPDEVSIYYERDSHDPNGSAITIWAEIASKE